MGALTVMQYLHDHGTARVAGVGMVDQSPRIVTDDEWRLGLFGGCSAAMLEGLIAGARKDLAETVLREIEAKAGMAAAAPGGRFRRSARCCGAGCTESTQRRCSILPSRLRQPISARSLPRLDAPLMVVLGKRSPHYADVPLESGIARPCRTRP